MGSQCHKQKSFCSCCYSFFLVPGEKALIEHLQRDNKINEMPFRESPYQLEGPVPNMDQVEGCEIF